MDKIKIEGYEFEHAVEIRIAFNDAGMKVRDWQEAYFKLLTYKNTWGRCYKLDMIALCDHSASIELIVNASYGEQYTEYIKYLYPADAIKVYDREVVTMEMEYNEKVDNYFVEW